MTRSKCFENGFQEALSRTWRGLEEVLNAGGEEEEEGGDAERGRGPADGSEESGVPLVSEKWF